MRYRVSEPAGPLKLGGDDRHLVDVGPSKPSVPLRDGLAEHRIGENDGQIQPIMILEQLPDGGRAVAHRRADATPDEPITDIPLTYTAHPLLRDDPPPAATAR
ncbi:hypothetical protein CC117_30385 [Parafrankia colletiae]|uniref:Uncharacterized protein n=2 Tax=Parafrankia colletiae TaxID=573497 RepID=A0A1S1Q4D2_9ACTN|nr:hypothetical protein CC117_30385 [Parafrankia colletiae]